MALLAKLRIALSIAENHKHSAIGLWLAALESSQWSLAMLNIVRLITETTSRRVADKTARLLSWQSPVAPQRDCIELALQKQADVSVTIV